MMIRRLAATAGTLFALLLGACSSGDEPGAQSAEGVPSAKQTSESPAETDSDMAVRDYFEKLASGDPAGADGAASVAALDSFAYAYAAHRANTATALADSGADVSGTYEVNLEEDSATLCSSSDATQCGTFASFAFRDGLLADFTVDGTALAGRLVIGDGSVEKSKGVAGFELLSAYQAVGTDSLVAVVRFHAYDRAINTSYVAAYRDPSGRQVEDGGESTLPSSIAPNSNQLGVVLIPRAAVGGELLLKFATDDDRDPLVVEVVKVSTSPEK